MRATAGEMVTTDGGDSSEMVLRRARVHRTGFDDRATVRLPPVHDHDAMREGCPYTAYRDTRSIFEDPQYPSFMPTFCRQQRVVPFLEPDAHLGGAVHAYSRVRPLEPSGPSGAVDWRLVGERLRRDRPPPPERKRAIPGSSLEQKRIDQSPQQRPRGSPARVAVVRGRSDGASVRMAEPPPSDVVGFLHRRGIDVLPPVGGAAAL